MCPNGTVTGRLYEAADFTYRVFRPAWPVCRRGRELGMGAPYLGGRMTTWNSTFKNPGKPLRRTARMVPSQSIRPRQRSKRGPGLAQRVAESAGTAIRHKHSEIEVLRSEEHRRNVAALDCVVCGRAGPSQCAHVNFGKGAGLKQCDSLTFPACPDCHREHDQGGMPRAERWQREWHYVDSTRAELLRFNLWLRSVERAYQKAIQPLSRMVRPEPKECPTSVAADSGVAQIIEGA